MGATPETTILIGGGVGPMAGVALHARIIENTVAREGDRSHLSVLHYSQSSVIPDRTEYLLALERGEPNLPNPGEAMAGVFNRAVRALPEGGGAVGGVPCNTFHAPVIFDCFLGELAAAGNPVRIVHMLDETLELLSARLSKKTGAGSMTSPCVGVLSTTGTRLSGIYDRLLERGGFEILYVAERDQDELHQAIYNPEWGIKAVSPPSERAVATVKRMAEQLLSGGAEAVIPGCTELPLALPGEWFGGVPLVDPVTALARALVREAAPEKLKR